MGFARCGVEGNLRNILENTRKKPFHFFCKFEKMKMVFASVRSPLEISVAVARTSQSPFPLPAMFRATVNNDTVCPTDNRHLQN